MTDVSQASVNLADKTVTVEGSTASDILISTIESAGYGAQLITTSDSLQFSCQFHELAGA